MWHVKLTLLLFLFGVWGKVWERANGLCIPNRSQWTIRLFVHVVWKPSLGFIFRIAFIFDIVHRLKIFMHRFCLHTFRKSIRKSATISPAYFIKCSKSISKLTKHWHLNAVIVAISCYLFVLLVTLFFPLICNQCLVSFRGTHSANFSYHMKVIPNFTKLTVETFTYNLKPKLSFAFLLFVTLN